MLLALLGWLLAGPGGLLLATVVLPVAYIQRDRLKQTVETTERPMRYWMGIWTIAAVAAVALGSLLLGISGGLFILAVEPVAKLLRGPPTFVGNGLPAAFHMTFWVPVIWPALFGLSALVRPTAHFLERAAWMIVGTYVWALILWLPYDFGP